SGHGGPSDAQSQRHLEVTTPARGHGMMVDYSKRRRENGRRERAYCFKLGGFLIARCQHYLDIPED
ncbi:hypothetical protein KUCAC02_006378, partial [Chaenocephalus aceratus]